MAIIKLSRAEIIDLTADPVPEMSKHDCDEMAVPSYSHGNPLIRWLMWRRYEEIERLADFPQGAAALEFGCGMGLFLRTLCDHSQTVSAIDLFPQYAQRLVARQGLDVNFIDAIEQVPDGSLDVVVAADVLEHVDDLPQWVQTFHAKLKPGGVALVSGPTENAVYQFGRWLAGFSDIADYHHTNINHIGEVFEENGFTVTGCSNLPFPLLPTLFKVFRFQR